MNHSAPLSRRPASYQDVLDAPENMVAEIVLCACIRGRFRGMPIRVPPWAKNFTVPSAAAAGVRAAG